MPPSFSDHDMCKSSDLRWCCDVCGYYTRYFHKAKECERMHFGPLITTPTDDIDERDDDDDDNGWNDGVVAVLRSPTLIPPGTPYPSLLEQPTPPTVSSSDSEDVGVKPTVDDGHIATATAEGIHYTKPKVSQSRCGSALCSPITTLAVG